MRKSSRTQIPCSLLLLHPYLEALILTSKLSSLWSQKGCYISKHCSYLPSRTFQGEDDAGQMLTSPEFISFYVRSNSFAWSTVYIALAQLGYTTSCLVPSTARCLGRQKVMRYIAALSKTVFLLARKKENGYWTSDQLLAAKLPHLTSPCITYTLISVSSNPSLFPLPRFLPSSGSLLPALTVFSARLTSSPVPAARCHPAIRIHAPPPSPPTSNSSPLLIKGWPDSSS